MTTSIALPLQVEFNLFCSMHVQAPYSPYYHDKHQDFYYHIRTRNPSTTLLAIRVQRLGLDLGVPLTSDSSSSKTGMTDSFILKIARLNIGAKCSKFLLVSRLPTFLSTYLLSSILAYFHICKFAWHANS